MQYVNPMAKYVGRTYTSDYPEQPKKRKKRVVEREEPVSTYGVGEVVPMLMTGVLGLGMLGIMGSMLNN